MSDYILDLRKIVGHRPLIQVGASILVEDGEGKILLQRRKDNHCWGYAGGSAGLDENVEDAARRELFEETGLAAGQIELFGVFSGKEMHYVYPNGDEVSNVDIVYICKDFSGELEKQESEVEELKFFDIRHLPEEISPPARPALKKWIEERKNTINDICIRFASTGFSTSGDKRIKDISEKGVQKIIENVRDGKYKSLYLSLNPDGEIDGYKYFTMESDDNWIAVQVADEENSVFYSSFDVNYMDSDEESPIECSDGQSVILKKYTMHDRELAADCAEWFIRTGGHYPGMEWLKS